LSSRTWTRFLKAASYAEPSLERRDGVPITRALVTVEATLAEAEKTPDSKPVVQAANDALTRLIGLTETYRPVDEDGAGHKSAQTYVDAIGALAEQKRRHLPVLS
jgi:hypothetical protein